jgi:hypothetical protein
VLLVWLVSATTVEFFYRPARQGRKIVYLTLASFGFLVLAMFGILTSEHGRQNAAAPTASRISRWPEPHRVAPPPRSLGDLAAPGDGERASQVAAGQLLQPVAVAWRDAFGVKGEAT